MRKYLSLQNNNLGNDPVSSPAWWSLQNDIEISQCYARKGTTHDLRNFVPWFSVGNIVAVKSVEGVYYIDETLTFVGSELVSSIRFSETHGRTRAVVV